MIQITPQMRMLVAIEPADFRKGIDGLARLCQETLKQDPFCGWVFVFRNRPATAIKALIYDGQGFWLCHNRLSSGRFPWWPAGRSSTEVATTLTAHQLQVLLSAGKGHGRNGADDYPGAEEIQVPHESLQPGDSCPECGKGTLYEQKTPGVLIRLVGQAPVGAKVYRLQKLRCGLCGEVFTIAGSSTPSNVRSTRASICSGYQHQAGFAGSGECPEGPFGG